MVNLPGYLGYLDCRAGIAGDMFLAAFLDSGVVTFSQLKTELQKLPIPGNWQIQINQVERNHFPGLQLLIKGNQCFPQPGMMLDIVRRSRLEPAIKKTAKAIITLLAEAEAKVHRREDKKKKIHFHELACLDTLIDSVGAAIVKELSGLKTLLSSPLNIGRAAPATIEILRQRQIPVFSSAVNAELVTPTGAAIAAVMVEDFGPLPPIIMEHSGAGAGTTELNEQPNLLRLYLGSSFNALSKENIPYNREIVFLLATNIDDLDPRVYPYLAGRLSQAGAKEVWWEQATMKQGRPGVIVKVLSLPDKVRELTRIIFRETTTLGIRIMPVERWVLPRRENGKKKIIFFPDGRQEKRWEYRWAVKQARQRKIPLREILPP